MTLALSQRHSNDSYINSRISQQFNTANSLGLSFLNSHDREYKSDYTPTYPKKKKELKKLLPSQWLVSIKKMILSNSISLLHTQKNQTRSMLCMQRLRRNKDHSLKIYNYLDLIKTQLLLFGMPNLTISVTSI